MQRNSQASPAVGWIWITGGEAVFFDSFWTMVGDVPEPNDENGVETNDQNTGRFVSRSNSGFFGDSAAGSQELALCECDGNTDGGDIQ